LSEDLSENLNEEEEYLNYEQNNYEANDGLCLSISIAGPYEILASGLNQIRLIHIEIIINQCIIKNRIS
jgi:hypothetical protein